MMDDCCPYCESMDVDTYLIKDYTTYLEYECYCKRCDKTYMMTEEYELKDRRIFDGEGEITND